VSSSIILLHTSIPTIININTSIIIVERLVSITMGFGNSSAYQKITTDPALIIKFEEQWRRQLEQRLAINSDDSQAMTQIELLNGPKDKYRWTNNLNYVALRAWDWSWHEEQLREDVHEQTKLNFRGDIPFSRHVLAAVLIHESPLLEDEDDCLVQYRLRNAIMEDESSPVIMAMNRDARNEVDAETQTYLLQLLLLTAQDDLDPRSPAFQAKLSEADASSKELYVECVGDFLAKLMSNMPPMESQLILMKRESDCHALIRTRLMLQAILSYLRSILHTAGPAFWGPEQPPMLIDGRWDQIQIGHGLDVDYARGIMKHQPRHVQIAVACDCAECAVLRTAIDGVTHDPPVYSTGHADAWESHPELVAEFSSTTLDDHTR
jgi:hypothetical protein